MIINEGVFSSTFATNLVIQDQITMGWPKHIAAYLGKGYLGLSFSGDGEKCYLSACGEYAERALFKKKIKGDFRSTLSSLPDDNRRQLSNFLKQMCPEQLVDEVDNHEFDMCKVRSIFNDEECILVPTAILSVGDQSDSRFVCSRDTTGNSVHFDSRKCFENSLFEFVERQSLISSFLYSHGKVRFKIDQLSIFGKSESFIRKLVRYGEIHAADISLFDGAYTILLCFSSHKRGASVKFAVGCSTSLSIVEAFEKSACELYSSFVTMLSVYEGSDGSYYKEYEKSMDYYLKLFYNKNNCDTYKEFQVFANDVVPSAKTSEAVLFPNKETTRLFEDISKVSKKVYAFQTSISFPAGEDLHICKIFSLEMFYNMDVSRKCNLENRITQMYGAIDPRSLGSIPFP